MTSSLRILALALALVAVVAAACTGAGAGSPVTASPGPTDPPTSGKISYPTGADDLVLRFRYVGGFAPPSAHLMDLPVVSVYGDGTVIVPGPQLAIYPGPALPNLQGATITPAGMQILLAAARDAGLLGPDAHYDLGGIMDASTAEFTLNADGSVHTVSAYALMEGEGRTPELPGSTDPAVADARARLSLFQGQLGSLEALLDTEIGSWSAFEPDAVQLLVTLGAPDDGQGLAQEPIAWPLDADLATFGDALPTLMESQRCGVVSGTDLDALWPLLVEANGLTPWTDDQSFGIAARPLLPAEEGCPTAAA
jgi:hypothetical protein